MSTNEQRQRNGYIGGMARLVDLEYTIEPGNPVAITCPTCNHAGTFEPLTERVKLYYPAWVHNDTGEFYEEDINGSLCLWCCPNRNCQEVIFGITDHTFTNVVITFPPMRIGFDRENIPQRVLEVFEEAVTCHANGCYKAAAMLLRKTIEELCEDRGAKGDNLDKRIKALGKIIILPQGMLDAMHNLRYLGNDAAHIDATTYRQVGENEVNIGIEATKELLRALYQYKDILMKLETLKNL